VAGGVLLAAAAISVVMGGSLDAALADGAANAVEAAAVAALVRWQRAGGFRSPRDAWTFVAAAVLGAALGATLGAAADQLLEGVPFAETYRTWFAADLVGMLLVVPMATLVTVRGLRSRVAAGSVLLLLLSVGLAVLAAEATMLGLPFLVFVSWLALLLSVLLVGVRHGIVALGVAQVPAAVVAFILVRDASAQEWLARQGVAAVIAASLLVSVLTLRHQLEQRTEADRLARDMFERLPVATARVLVPADDGAIDVIDANAAWSGLLGATIPHDLLRWVHPDDAAGLRAGLVSAMGKPVDVRGYLRGSGEASILRVVSVSLGGREADGSQSVVVAVEDVTAERERERSLRQQATTDPLTGLMNRTTFEQTLAHWSAVEGPERLGLLFVDLDGFKAVNDTQGHRAGDAVLVEVARRIMAEVRPRDVASRLGGDEFVVLAVVDRLDDLRALASRLQVRLREPVSFEGRQVPCSASIGAAVGRRDDTPDRLLERADRDMYLHKREPGRTPAEN
jgi:diguanylate cyclase (GGDEF)-like protein